MRVQTVNLAAPGGYEHGIECELGRAETFADSIALYEELAPLWPTREVLLCDGARIVRRSTRPENAPAPLDEDVPAFVPAAKWP